MFSRFLENTRGNVAITAAIVIAVLCLGIGAATDYGFAYRMQQELQTSSDAAALAAASQPEKSDAELMTMVRDYTASNAPSNARLAAENVNVLITRSADRFRVTVDVVVRAALETSFMRLAKIETIPVAVRSVATGLHPAGTPCVFALDPSAPATFDVEGKGSVQTPKCGIQINSSNGYALVQKGASSVKAQSIAVVGGYLPNGVYSPLPKAFQLAVPDPLGKVEEPALPASCTYRDQRFTSAQTFAAGTVFCGNIAFNADATFQPGIHYFKDATVTTGSSANIIGNEVMLYFGPGSAFVKSVGTGSFKIGSMTTGYYKGIAIFGSRSSPSETTFTMAGNKDFDIDGTIYLPRTILRVYGDSDSSVSFQSGWIIAWRFLYSGNSTMVLDNEEQHISDRIYAKKVVLVQ